MRRFLVVLCLASTLSSTVAAAAPSAVTPPTRERAKRSSVPTIVRSARSLGFMLTIFGPLLHLGRRPTPRPR